MCPEIRPQPHQIKPHEPISSRKVYFICFVIQRRYTGLSNWGMTIPGSWINCKNDAMTLPASN